LALKKDTQFWFQKLAGMLLHVAKMNHFFVPFGFKKPNLRRNPNGWFAKLRCDSPFCKAPL
jgi:hypothetical protein